MAKVVQEFQSKIVLILLVCFSVQMMHLNPNELLQIQWLKSNSNNLANVVLLFKWGIWTQMSYYKTQWLKRDPNNLANIVQKFQSKIVLIMLACFSLQMRQSNPDKFLEDSMVKRREEEFGQRFDY